MLWTGALSSNSHYMGRSQRQALRLRVLPFSHRFSLTVSLPLVDKFAKSAMGDRSQDGWQQARVSFSAASPNQTPT
jgi:hypothetical protein